jgi:hypothetical protein
MFAEGKDVTGENAGDLRCLLANWGRADVAARRRLSAFWTIPEAERLGLRAHNDSSSLRSRHPLNGGEETLFASGVGPRESWLAH